MNWKKVLFGEPEKRSLPQPEDPSVSDGTILSWAGIGELGALNLSTFYRGVHLISTSISQLPIYTKRVSGKGESNILKSHYTNMLWNDPSNLIDKTTMLRSIVQSVIIKGNAYVYISRAEDGTPVNLRFLPSSDVILTYNKERNELYYNCSYINHGKRIMPSNMLHFKLFTYDGVKGISVLKFAFQSIETSNVTNVHAKDFFEKGTNKASGVLTVNSQLNEKQRLQILNTWNTTYSSGKSGLAVLQGNMTYQPISVNADEAQMLESREYNQADVAHWLNLNPSQLGLKGYQSYSNFEDLQSELLQRTLMPYIVMIENELTRKLVPNERNIKIVIDTVQYLRPNKQAQSNYYTSLVSGGILSINEARRELGFPAIDGCDTPIIPYTAISQNIVGTTQEPKEDNNNNQDTNTNDGEGTEKPQRSN